MSAVWNEASPVFASAPDGDFFGEAPAASAVPLVVLGTSRPSSGQRSYSGDPSVIDDGQEATAVTVMWQSAKAVFDNTSWEETLNSKKYEDSCDSESVYTASDSVPTGSDVGSSRFNFPAGSARSSSKGSRDNGSNHSALGSSPGSNRSGSGRSTPNHAWARSRGGQQVDSRSRTSPQGQMADNSAGQWQRDDVSGEADAYRGDIWNNLYAMQTGANGLTSRTGSTSTTDSQNPSMPSRRGQPPKAPRPPAPCGYEVSLAAQRGHTIAPPDHSSCGALLWCEAHPHVRSGGVEQLAQYFRNRRSMYFQTPGKFTRWIFDQQRGRINPWATLVVGWREAKPCASAIQATRTGRPDSLRPDARRPHLRAPTGMDAASGAILPRVAVGVLIVLLKKEEQEERATIWARDQSSDPSVGLDTFVATSLEHLELIVAALTQGGPSAAAVAAGVAPTADLANDEPLPAPSRGMPTTLVPEPATSMPLPPGLEHEAFLRPGHVISL